mgnify:CR=1 FL=1
MIQKNEKIICQNKRAYHDYFIEEEIEAGIVLRGTEIKSIRLGKVNLQDSYCYFKDNELFIIGMHISPYEKGNIFNHDADATRKLLVNKREILKYSQKVQKDGFTLVPLRVVIRNSIAKVDIALCKGKKLYDKREDLKKSAANEEIKKAVKKNLNKEY